MASRVLSSRLIWIVAISFVVVLLLSYGAHSDAPYILRPTRRGSLLDSIRNETLGFQKIFVINLKSRTDRRDGLALAASLTGVRLEFMEAEAEVSKKALPPGAAELGLSAANLGSWRSHVNAARTMVENNIQSALILEDDVDWDIRIKEQLYRAAPALQALIQPLSGTKDQFLDPTFFGQREGEEPRTFVIGQAPEVESPTTSPYGDLDRWDLLWLGHCGARTPAPGDSSSIPFGRAVVLDDETVPEPQHINSEFGDDVIKDSYPPHSRAVFRPGGIVCSLGYALSIAGARKLLYELSVRKLDAPFDADLDAFCTARNDRPLAKCLVPVPQFFQHHRPAGSWSTMTDIGFLSEDINPSAFTTNIRYSTRVNLPKLVVGDTDYIDMFKDGEPSTGL